MIYKCSDYNYNVNIVKRGNKEIITQSEDQIEQYLEKIVATIIL